MPEHRPEAGTWDAEKACLRDSDGLDASSGDESEAEAPSRIEGCYSSRSVTLLGCAACAAVILLSCVPKLQLQNVGQAEESEAEFPDASGRLPPLALPAFAFVESQVNFSAEEHNMSAVEAKMWAQASSPTVPFAPVTVDGIQLTLDKLRGMSKGDLGKLRTKLEPVVMAAKMLQAAPIAPTPPPLPPALELPMAPAFTFYLYRAQNDHDYYPFGNVNAANLPGVMWYLANEVMPRCPRRYDITRIKRILVTTRATPELYLHGMNYGVRYSYDAGKCTGSNTRNLGPCTDTWNRFGYVPGCNNFKDKFPYPLVDTEYPAGVWYDLPLEGKCEKPTGAWNCTWSAEDAGEIRLAELEKNAPGYGYCCHGNCTGFWQGVFVRSACDRRIQQAADLFRQKYPEMPDKPLAFCDFNRKRFWG